MDKNMVRLHHVGIAVKNIDSVQKIFNQILGLSFDTSMDVDAQKVRIAYSNATGDESVIELIEATDEKSPIYPILDHPIHSFIKDKGEGVHHLCFEVDDLENVLLDLEKLDINTVGGGVLEGSGKGKVAFLNPKDCAGILIELREKHN